MISVFGILLGACAVRVIDTSEAMSASYQEKSKTLPSRLRIGQEWWTYQQIVNKRVGIKWQCKQPRHGTVVRCRDLRGSEAFTKAIELECYLEGDGIRWKAVNYLPFDRYVYICRDVQVRGHIAWLPSAEEVYIRYARGRMPADPPLF